MAEFQGFEDVLVTTKKVQLYPNDNTKLSLEMYRKLINKFYVKKEKITHHSSSKRSLLMGIKSGSLHIHRPSAHKKNSSSVLSNISQNTLIHQPEKKTRSPYRPVSKRREIRKT